MKVLVLGAGKMAQGIVYDLLKNENIEKLYIVDMSKIVLFNLTKKFGDRRIECKVIAVKDIEQLRPLFEETDGVLSAIPYDYNAMLSQLAIETQTHFVDLGGNNSIVSQQFLLHEKAVAAGIGIVPDCGLAPGMVSVISALAVSKLSKVKSLEIRVGGLPLTPSPPLNYSIVFSIHGLINEYIEPALILQDGHIKQIPSLTEVEKLEFPQPFGTMEAFYTSGGSSTLPETYKGKINNLDYKTIRYSGHCQLMKSFADLGFMNDEDINVDGYPFTKRRLFEKMLSTSLPYDEEDVVLIRITAQGEADGEEKTVQFQAVEYGDTEAGLSAMMRTTAFSAAIILQMLMDNRIQDRGVLYQEISIPQNEFLNELEKRNIIFDITN